MLTTTRRDRRRFQPTVDALSSRIAPTVFTPIPVASTIGEVTIPDCGPSTPGPGAGAPTTSWNLVEVSVPSCRI